MQTNSIAIIGCGWLGEPLALSLLTDGFEVLGTTRSDEKRNALAQKGIHAFIFDAFDDSAAKLPEALVSVNTLFLNIPPGMRSSSNPAEAEERFLEGMKRILSQYDFDKTHLVAASSTSVYPELNTEMDESFGGQGSPSGVAGNGLRKFEQMCIDLGGFNATILRFGGLYGLDRHPVRFFAGKKELTGGMQRVNMVSLDRCLLACSKVIRTPFHGEILNVVDEEHPARATFYEEAAKEKNLEIPSFLPDGNHLYGKCISSAKLDALLKD